MKNITWITSGYLLQVDLPILSYLKDYYQIHWVVIAKDGSDKQKTACEYAQEHDIEIEFCSPRGHRYLPLCLMDYFSLMKRLSQRNSDIYYFNMITFPYAIFAIQKFIDSHKIIVAMHHGKIHKGMQLRHIYKYYLKFLCNKPYSFQYFSESQAAYFSGKDRNRTCVIPLALNDFGKSTDKPDNQIISFLSFGHIIETKNIGLLIQAACKLKEMIDIPFKVKIVGHCRQWESIYQPLIKYPEIFDLDIRMVPDSMIPQLFSSSHYLILPYKAVTQSGPLRIAYGYNMPVIASDLEGFQESVVDGVTGLLFKSEDVQSLINTMKECVTSGYVYYEKLKDKQNAYVKSNLDVMAVVAKYKSMFDIFKSNI